MKNFRTLKATLMMGIMLISIFIIFAPSSSAALFTFNQDLDMSYDLGDYDRVTPLKGFSIDLNVKYQFNGLFLKEGISELLSSNQKAQVTIHVGDTDPWVTAVVMPSPTIFCDFQTEFKEISPRQLYVKFTEDAPAGRTVKIPITLEAKGIQLPFIEVKKRVQEGFEIAFDTKFLPIIDAQTNQKYVEVTPGNVATFDTNLINSGNAETEFIFSTKDVPEGWIVSYPSKALVSSSNSGGEKTISIQITPPYQFGWHDETKRITVEYYGRYFAGGDEMTSEPYELILIVRNRGFSISAFEFGIIVVIIALIIIALLILKKVKLPFKKNKA